MTAHGEGGEDRLRNSWKIVSSGGSSRSRTRARRSLKCADEITMCEEYSGSTFEFVKLLSLISPQTRVQNVFGRLARDRFELLLQAIPQLLERSRGPVGCPG